MLKKILLYIASATVAFSVLIQLVPYGRRHTNPPVNTEPEWQGEQTRALVVRACFDCHSNQVRWPWYSNVAPISWLIQSHVDEGREELNYSEWDLFYDEADESAETVLEGEMPPADYIWLHPSARLSDSERLELISGLEATFGAAGARSEDGKARHDQDDDD